MGESNAYKLNVSVLQPWSRHRWSAAAFTVLTARPCPRSASPSRHSSGSARRSTNTILSASTSRPRHSHVKAARQATIGDIEQRAEAPAEGKSSLGTHSCTNARHTDHAEALLASAAMPAPP